jgi:hypothetical protein
MKHIRHQSAGSIYKLFRDAKASWKRLVFLFFFIPGTVFAQGIPDDCEAEGCAYDDSSRAINLAPVVAIGTLSLVGIIALASQSTHRHSSSSSSSSYSYRHYYSHYSSYSHH